MEYLTLRLSTISRGPIYERDFSVKDVFGAFAQVFITDLIQEGLIRGRQTSWVSIEPGYDGQPNFDQTIIEGRPSAPHAPRQSWIVLVNEPRLEDAPMRYFTLNLNLDSPEPKTFRRDFHISKINYLIDRVKTSLLQMGIAKTDEAIQADLYVRSGDAPNFNQEVVHTLPEEMNDFEIRLAPAPAEEVVQEKPMPICVCEHSETDFPDELIIFFKSDCLLRLSQYLILHASRRQETGGILVGEVYRKPGREQLYVEIEEFIPAEQAQANAVSLRFTHETFQMLREKKAARFPDNKPIVGWYHTHPPMAISLGEHQVRTTQFFSADDRALHQQILNKPWQVALVMDAESSEKIFFKWAGNEIVNSGFHVSP